jgi:hypothetical protein
MPLDHAGHGAFAAGASSGSSSVFDDMCGTSETKTKRGLPWNFPAESLNRTPAVRHKRFTWHLAEAAPLLPEVVYSL